MMEQRDIELRLAVIIILLLAGLDLMVRAIVAEPIPALIAPHHHMHHHMIAVAAKGDRLDRATFDERFGAAAPQS